MNTVVCKVCHQTSSVSLHTEKIRCYGCEGIISVGSSQESVPFGKSQLPGQHQDYISVETKGFRNFCKRISGNVNPTTSPSFNQCLTATARISDTPPRGKRALLCGVTYADKKFKLRGTTQDIISMANLLIEKFSFPPNGILVLAEHTSYEHPTRHNILRAFEWLVKDLHSKDSLVFFFSGHGLRQPEFQGDELDGFDEAICPVDFETAGLIIDDDINKMIVRPLKQGVILHAIIDACHSGTVLDLPHVYGKKEGSWKENYPTSGAFKGTSGGKAICFSACEDYQQAADTSALSPEKIMSGAMTYTFVNAIKENQGITYRELLDYVHKAIEDANNSQRGFRMLNRLFHRKMLQDPLLSSTEVFDANTVFKL